MSKLFELISCEAERQEKKIELIASENFVSKDVMLAAGSVLTNKYAEGYPGKRYYGGCEIVDQIESYCQKKWQEVFQTDYHVNVQPHSGSNANFASYMAVLNPGDTILSMNLWEGGHLSHGSPVNFSGKLYNIISYNVDADGWIDYEDFKQKILNYRPKLILAGASAYSRIIDFKKMYDLIQEIRGRIYRNHMELELLHIKQDDNGEYNPIFMVDMSHIAGLVAAGLHPSPFGYADIITTTTHKTLRGTRGGLIFCKPAYAKAIDSAVFPGTQGGPLMHIIAAKAVTAEEACTEKFKEYIKRVVNNCKAMADEFQKMGYHVVTGGTDNHLFLIDFSKTHPNLTGKTVQEVLDDNQISVNKNCVPGETRSPFQTSGIRIGTAAMTTKGYTEENFRMVARTIDEIIKSI